jgi:hypothetical protein
MHDAPYDRCKDGKQFRASRFLQVQLVRESVAYPLWLLGSPEIIQGRSLREPCSIQNTRHLHLRNSSISVAGPCPSFIAPAQAAAACMVLIKYTHGPQ